jgi:hypothetical protein
MNFGVTSVRPLQLLPKPSKARGSEQVCPFQPFRSVRAETPASSAFKPTARGGWRSGQHRRAAEGRGCAGPERAPQHERARNTVRQRARERERNRTCVRLTARQVVARGRFRACARLCESADQAAALARTGPCAFRLDPETACAGGRQSGCEQRRRPWLLLFADHHQHALRAWLRSSPPADPPACTHARTRRRQQPTLLLVPWIPHLERRWRRRRRQRRQRQWQSHSNSIAQLVVDVDLSIRAVGGGLAQEQQEQQEQELLKLTDWKPERELELDPQRERRRRAAAAAAAAESQQ